MQSNKSNGQLTAQINISDHKKSGFDLSNNVLGTGKIGRIIPTRALHVMPGDTIKQDSKCAVQFEPLAVPILANMDVKQEHFYVPYNVVWKNWDKFISGGEKMDYQGVVPNISMRGIVSAITSVFSTFGQGAPKVYLPALGIRKFSSELSIDRVSAFYHVDQMQNPTVSEVHNKLDELGDLYGVKDLLSPMYEAASLFNRLTNDYNINKTPCFCLFNFDDFIDLEDLETFIFDTYAEYFDNKYTRELWPVFVNHLTIYQGKNILVPTSDGIAALQSLYEFYKPLIGIGSNIDYLNMNRLTFVDFLYNYLNSYISSYGFSEKGDEPSVFVSIIVIQYLSNSPMSILALRANYNIWYNNYRDILLETDAFEPYDGDEINNDEIFNLLLPRQRCWEKDAFTTALDNPGTGSVGVPITTDLTTSELYQITKQNSVDNIHLSDGGEDIAEVVYRGNKYKIPTPFLSGVNPILESSEETAGFSLHMLDAAQRAQKWLQKALFFGNRISDFYYMRFGVRFLDARLRLPELLSSSSELVNIDVLMNNTTTSESIAGDRAGYASAYDKGNSFDRFCEEHGLIMSYLTIMPQITYAYGTNRDYSRLDQFDFAFSEFATLGMDAVYSTEITNTPSALPSSYNTDTIFGYQGRYYDYKAKHSEEHGELLDSQDMYTFARKFNMYDPASWPKLNYEFVHCFPSLDMFVVDSPLADYFRYDIRHSTAAERNLPAQSLYI